MATILEGFLVRLGFEIDKDGLEKFNASVGKAAKRVGSIAKAGVATGVALGAAFAKTTADVNKLYKTANDTGASIRGMTALGRAADRVGGSAQNINAAFSGLTDNIKLYGKAFEDSLMTNLGVSLYDQTGKLRDMSDVFLEMRDRLAEIAETNPGLARMQAETLGIGAAFDDIMKKDFPAEFERANRALLAMGTSLDDNAKRAHTFTNSLGRIWDSIADGTKTAAMDFLEFTGIDKWMDRLATEAEVGIPAAIKGIEKTYRQYESGERSISQDLTIDQSRLVLREDFSENGETDPELSALLKGYEERHKNDRNFEENFSDNFAEARGQAKKVYGGERPQYESGERSISQDLKSEKFEKVRGFRNNNPGNLRSGAGQTGTDDGGYATFKSMDDGYKAMVKQISMYRNSGLENVASIVSKWAPSSENDTKAYIQSVVASMQKDLGKDVSATSQINLFDPKVMDSLIDAMIDHENGAGASTYFDGAAFSQSLQEAMQTKQASKVVSEKDKIPSTVTVNQNITVNGAGDPMRTAKTIQSHTNEAVNRNAGSNIM